LGKVAKLESKTQPVPKVCRRLQRRQAGESPLTPELKAFIDAIIVPILVKQYLALDRENELDLAERDFDAAHSVSSTAAPGLREVRP
jgi:hypothetical protein